MDKMSFHSFWRGRNDEGWVGQQSFKSSPRHPFPGGLRPLLHSLAQAITTGAQVQGPQLRCIIRTLRILCRLLQTLWDFCLKHSASNRLMESPTTSWASRWPRWPCCAQWKQMLNSMVAWVPRAAILLRNYTPLQGQSPQVIWIGRIQRLTKSLASPGGTGSRKRGKLAQKDWNRQKNQADPAQLCRAPTKVAKGKHKYAVSTYMSRSPATLRRKIITLDPV